MNTPAYSKPPFIKFNDATGSGETFAGIKVRAYEFTKLMGGAAPCRDFATHWSMANAPEEKQVRLFHEDDMNRMLCLVHEKTRDLERADIRRKELMETLASTTHAYEQAQANIEELNELVGLAIQALGHNVSKEFLNSVLVRLEGAHQQGTKPVYKKDASDFVWQYRTYSGGQPIWTNTHHSNVQALRADGIEVRCMAEITKGSEPFVAPGPEGFGLNPTITLQVPDAEAATVPIAKIQPFLWDGRASASLIGSHVVLNGPEDPELVYNHIVLGVNGGCSMEALEQLFAGNYGGKLPEVGQEIKLVCTGRTDSEIYINMRAVPAPHHKV